MCSSVRQLRSAKLLDWPGAGAHNCLTLYCVRLHCGKLQHTTLQDTICDNTAGHCNRLHCTTLNWSVLHCILLSCNIPFRVYTSLHCVVYFVLRWSLVKPSIGRVFGHDKFGSWHMSADYYQLPAIIVIIAIITINCDYRQNCHLAIIAIIWRLSRLLRLWRL